MSDIHTNNEGEQEMAPETKLAEQAGPGGEPVTTCYICAEPLEEGQKIAAEYTRLVDAAGRPVGRKTYSEREAHLTCVAPELAGVKDDDIIDRALETCRTIGGCVCADCAEHATGVDPAIRACALGENDD
jgi:hypothetical protein